MAVDDKLLKAYGIVLGNSSLIAKAYETMRAVPILPITGKALIVLDLDSLPLKPFPFKEVFLRWALRLNEGRLLAGEEPIFPFELVRACPLWKAIPMPIKRLDMTKESMFNRPSNAPAVITAKKSISPGSINRR
jgi:hypothetical protein